VEEAVGETVDELSQGAVLGSNTKAALTSGTVSTPAAQGKLLNKTKYCLALKIRVSFMSVVFLNNSACNDTLSDRFVFLRRTHRCGPR
jgi:hypothetical protein